MKRLFLLVSIFLILSESKAQEPANQYDRAVNVLHSRGEVYFSFTLPDLLQLSKLTQMVSIDKVEGNTIFAYANQKEFSEFTSLGFNFEVKTAPSELYTVKMTDSPYQVLTWNYYPTYTAYETLMQQFAADHPQICKLITISTLKSGRKILALKAAPTGR